MAEEMKTRHWYEHKGFGCFVCSVCGKNTIGDGANDTPYNDMKCRGE